MNFPSQEIVKEMREKYPVGTRVRLIKMDDAQAPPIGTPGTVIGVDDIGSIMVRWDNSSGLNVVYGEDECEIVKDCERCKHFYTCDNMGLHEDCLPDKKYYEETNLEA